MFRGNAVSFIDHLEILFGLETIYFLSLTARLECTMEFRPFVTAYRPVTRVGNWNEDLFLKAENDAGEFKKMKTDFFNNIVQFKSKYIIKF